MVRRLPSFGGEKVTVRFLSVRRPARDVQPAQMLRDAKYTPIKRNELIFVISRDLFLLSPRRTSVIQVLRKTTKRVSYLPGGAQRRAGPSPGGLRRLWESRTVGSVVAAVDRLHTRGGADVHVFRAGPEVGPQVLMMYCSASRVVTPPVYILYKSISYRCGFNPARALSGVRAATTVTHSRPASSLRVRLDPPDSCKTEDAGENHSAAPANHSAAPARCRPHKQAAAANSRAGSA